MKCAERAFITCEGECSKDKVHWTTHAFSTEADVTARDPETGEIEPTYRQDYACTICGCVRQFGLTNQRMTRKGERN